MRPYAHHSSAQEGEKEHGPMFEVEPEQCYKLQIHSWVCNSSSLQQPFKSPAKASGIRLDLELDLFV